MIKFDFLTNDEHDGFYKYLESIPYVNDLNIRKIHNFYIKNNANILRELDRSVLIKGEVQSGKTNNIIYLINKLSKNVKYFIYLSGHLNKLNEQNKERINAALRFSEFNFKSANMNLDVMSPQYIKRKVETNRDRIIFFGIKKKEYLSNVFEAITRNDPDANIVIFDDESDSHTISDEQIDLRKYLLSKINIKMYISITATPYINLYKYQNMYDAFYVYKSHDRYTGLKSFLDADKYKDTSGLSEEKIFKNLVLNLARSKNGSIIWNTDRKIYHHKKYFHLIKKWIENMRKNSEIYKDILKNLKISFDHFILVLDSLYTNVFISNSKYRSSESTFFIIIGRENMSRGITYKNLMSEYIYMNNKKYNPAVIMQSSRWFGTREIDNLLVIMNNNLIEAYKECLILEDITDKFDISFNYKEEYNSLNFKYLKKLDKI